MPHRVGAVVLPHLLRRRGRERHPGGRRQQVGEGSAGLGELVDAGELAGDLERRHVLEHTGHVGVFGLQVGVEARLDRLGVEGGAVVERHTVAQGQRVPGEVLVGLEGLRQVRLHRPLGGAGHQRVHDGEADLLARDAPADRTRPPAVLLGREGDADALAADRLTFVTRPRADVVARSTTVARGVTAVRGLVAAVTAGRNDQPEVEHQRQESSPCRNEPRLAAPCSHDLPPPPRSTRVGPPAR